jgi:uncharacterized protein (TIGR03085 family)
LTRGPVARDRGPIGTIADDIAAERRGLLQTLHSVGPEAPTLAAGWRASDVARHLVAQDRVGGWPACLARGFVVRTGLRLSEVYLDRPFVARLLNGRPRSWEWCLDRLDRRPPGPVLRPLVAPIALWEHFVHHEDVRRPASVARSTQPDLSPTIPWLLRYNRSRLRDVSVHVVTEEGPEWRAGRDRRELALRGPLSEIVLWLSGRDASVGVDAAGPSALADALHNRLRI